MREEIEKGALKPEYINQRMVPGSSVKGKAGKGKNKRQVKGGNQQNVTSLSEGTRIKVAQILEQFQISNDEGQ